MGDSGQAGGLAPADAGGTTSARGGRAWRAAVLGLAVLVVFWPAVGFDYTNYDDPDYVAHQALVQQGITWEGVRWAFTTTSMGHWHPLTWLSYMACSQWLGGGPAAQHFVSVALHAANAALLFLALSALTRTLNPAWLVAALFALHPLHVESVAWVASRKDVLCGAFWTGALWCYAHYARQPSPLRWAAVTACFAGATLSKPSGLTLPFLLLLLDAWPLQRWTGTGTATSRPAVPWPRLLGEKIPLFLLSGVSVITSLWASHAAGVFAAAVPVSLMDRIGNALVSYVLYLAKTLFPTSLAALYPHPGAWAFWQVAAATALLLLLTLAACAFLARAPWLAVGWCWFLGMMVPTIGLVQVGLQGMADRYTYLPLTGLFLAAVWTGKSLWPKGPGPRRAGQFLAVATLAACALGTRAQLRHWRNTEALFTRALAVTRDNAVAHNNLALALAERGQVDEAQHHFQEAVRIRPFYPEAHSNLGLALAMRGRFEEAIQHYRIALEQDPASDTAHFNLGIALRAQGHSAQALEQFNAALRHRPKDTQARVALGRLLTELGRPDEARVPLEEALALHPSLPEAHLALALTMLRLGRHAEAGASLRKALEHGPGLAEAHAEYGAWLAAQGAAREAIASYQQALQLHPDYPMALNNLAWILATTPHDNLRQGDAAVRLAERAGQLTRHQEPFMLGTLAAAYAETGRQEEAIQTASRAIDLAEAKGLTQVAQRNRELREIYRSGQPWREPVTP